MGETSFGPFDTQFFSDWQGKCCWLPGLWWGGERAAYKGLPAGSLGMVMPAAKSSLLSMHCF